MKRINIYITEETDKDINNLSELLQLNRSEIMRKALGEFTDNHISELNEFMTGVERLEVNSQKNNTSEKFLIECNNNPEFFIENCLKINTIDNGIVPFMLYKHQKHLLFKLDTYKRIIINTSRQLGLSSLVTGDMLHYLIFNSYKNVVVASHTQSQSYSYVNRMVDMIKQLPPCIKDDVVESSTTRGIVFKNGSRLHAVSPSASHVKGITINYLFVDNFAHIPRNQADEFIKSIFPVVTSGINNKIVIASTPTRINHFYKIWSDAISNYNSFQAIKLPWHLMENRDSNWELNQKQYIGEKAFECEFNCEFDYEMNGDLYGV